MKRGWRAAFYHLAAPPAASADEDESLAGEADADADAGGGGGGVGAAPPALFVSPDGGVDAVGVPPPGPGAFASGLPRAPRPPSAWARGDGEGAVALLARPPRPPSRAPAGAALEAAAARRFYAALALSAAVTAAVRLGGEGAGAGGAGGAWGPRLGRVAGEALTEPLSAAEWAPLVTAAVLPAWSRPGQLGRLPSAAEDASAPAGAPRVAALAAGGGAPAWPWPPPGATGDAASAGAVLGGYGALLSFGALAAAARPRGEERDALWAATLKNAHALGALPLLPFQRPVRQTEAAAAAAARVGARRGSGGGGGGGGGGGRGWGDGGGGGGVGGLARAPRPFASPAAGAPPAPPPTLAALVPRTAEGTAAAVLALRALLLPIFVGALAARALTVATGTFPSGAPAAAPSFFAAAVGLALDAVTALAAHELVVAAGPDWAWAVDRQILC